jgi:hypothetical protein
MEKIFFAKYLPVAGEVQEGDKYLETLVFSINEVLTHSGMVYYGDELNGTYKIPLIQSVEGGISPKDFIIKVKLFLCTRDIKVGDQVYWEYPKGISPTCLTVAAIPETTEGLSYLDENYLLTYPSEIVTCNRNIFKPIGEFIPSRSSHIKEGDEFDMEEARKLVSFDL